MFLGQNLTLISKISIKIFPKCVLDSKMAKSLFFQHVWAGREALLLSAEAETFLWLSLFSLSTFDRRKF